MTPEIEAAIRKVQATNVAAKTAEFNLQEAEKVLGACHLGVDVAGKDRVAAEHALIKLVRGGGT